jgi:Tfp pilus assembly protein PilO
MAKMNRNAIDNAEEKLEENEEKCDTKNTGPMLKKFTTKSAKAKWLESCRKEMKKTTTKYKGLLRDLMKHEEDL